jgi:thymidine kinase
MGGRLEIIMGCMFSGKSTELIRRLKRWKAICNNVLVINSSKDTRSGEQVLKTHDGVTFDCIKTLNLLNIYNEPVFRNAAIIGIDEGQFFDDIENFTRLAISLNKHVIIASLDGDSSQQVFGNTLNLIPLADDVDKLKALCMECNDGTLAPFTKRNFKGGGQEMVGSNDIYTAVCREHLFDISDLLMQEVINEHLGT